jgi:hypothetical protein
MPNSVDAERRWLVLSLAAVTTLFGIVQFARLTELAVQISGMSGALLVASVAALGVA